MSLLFPFVSAILIPLLIVAPLAAEPAPSSVLHVDAKCVGGAISILVTDESGAPVPDAAVAVRLPETGDTGAFSDGTRAAVAYTDNHGEAHVSVTTWNTQAGVVPVRIAASKGAARAGMLLEQKVGPDAPLPEPVSASPTHTPDPQPSAPETAVLQPGRLQTRAVTSPVTSPSPQAQPSQPLIPMVSITHGPTHERLSSGSHKKWIILAAVVGVGAGAGFALGSKKSSSTSSSTSSSAPTIGTPTVSVGTP